MNKTRFISTILLVTAFSFAAGESTTPESFVPTPAEKQEIAKETPDLSQKERADWQRMREERKQAREQILSRLREASPSERKQMRQEKIKNHDKRSRFDDDFPKNQINNRDFSNGRPGSPNMEAPGRDKQDVRPQRNQKGRDRK